MSGTNAERGYVIPMGGEVEKFKDPVIPERFFELSGGSDANILVIPTASELSETGPDYADLFKSMGVSSRYIPVDECEDCFKEEIQATLQEATSIFITGGNQLRLSTIIGECGDESIARPNDRQRDPRLRAWQRSE